MDAKRTTALFIPSLTLTAIAGAASLGAGACTAYPTLKNMPTVDCSVENGYVFDKTPVPPGNAYSASDNTPGAVSTVASTAIPDGALCGQPDALVITWSGNNDWGGLVGFYSFGTSGSYRDESAFQGLSFWARAPGASNRGFTLALDDANTDATSADAGINCVNYGGDGGFTGPIPTYIDPATGVPLSGVSTTAPPPNACGNSYAMVMGVTADWQFYTVPFTQFHQGATPNRVPNADLMETGAVPGSGLLTNKLMNIIFRLPRGATTNLWIGKLNFYRAKSSGAVGDGGMDAS
jgi:hypothetical protein